MISPDDLYRACVLFEELKLPVKLRRFESGVLVVQSGMLFSKTTNSLPNILSVNQTDDVVAKQIVDLIRLDGPQTAFDLSRNKNISLALATEELLVHSFAYLLC